MKRKYRIFLDANVWFSALYGSENCMTLVNAYFRGEFHAIVSRQVLEELSRNIQKKLPRSLPVLEQWISLFPPEVIADPLVIDPNIRSLIHPKDQDIFAAAMEAQTDYFVTGNTKDFSVGKLEEQTGIKVVTPKEAIVAVGL